MDSSELAGTNDALGGGNATRKSRISYYYDEDFSVFQFSEAHPMKPLRVKMTDTLIKEYDLHRKMDPIEVDQAYINNVDLSTFHSDDYVDCLKHITVDQKERYAD